MCFWQSVLQELPDLVIIIIGTFIGALVGALIAVWAGSRTQRKIEERKQKEQRRSNLEQLRIYLKAFRTEIETNILFLESLRNEDAREAISTAALCTSTRDTCLANLGRIPLPQINRVIENLIRAYNCFDKVNQIWGGIQTKIMSLYQSRYGCKKPQVLKDEVIDGTLAEARPALDRIKEVEEEIDSLLDRS